MDCRTSILENLLQKSRNYSLEELNQALLIEKNTGLCILLLESLNEKIKKFNTSIDINQKLPLLKLMKYISNIIYDMKDLKLKDELFNLNQVLIVEINNFNANKFDTIVKLSKSVDEVISKLSTIDKTENVSNGFSVLNDIVFNEKNIELLKSVIAVSPEIVNAKDSEGNFFIDLLLSNYIEMLKDGNKNSLSNILFFDLVIDKFINTKELDYTKLSGTLMTRVNNALQDINHNRKNERPIFLLEQLKIKLKNQYSQVINSEEDLNYKYNRSNNFSQRVLNEVKELITNNERIVDMTNLYTITIDPDGSQDLDDAISHRKLTNGNDMLYVHIADVSSYVIPGSAIDREAYKRGETLYLIDKTMNMLPEEISNRICSLLPNGKKSAITGIFEIDKDGCIVNYEFKNSIISVNKRLTYEDVSIILKTGNTKDTLFNLLKKLQIISSMLNESNNKKSSYRKLQDEIERINANNNTIDIKNVNLKLHSSHKIISEFMVLINHKVAEIAKTKQVPFIYRVHEEVDTQKVLNELKGLKEHLTNNKTSEFEIQKKVENMISSALGSAYYSKYNIGHNALGLPCYCRFSSPIRRYPDLYDQRIMNDIILTPNVDDNIVYYYESVVDTVAKSLNKTDVLNKNYVYEYHKMNRIS